MNITACETSKLEKKARHTAFSVSLTGEEELPVHGFHETLPGFLGYLQFNGKALPVSRLTLSQHGAGILPQISIHIINLLARMVGIRFGGNACCPGYLNINADPEKGFDQWKPGTLAGCGVLVVNIKNPVTSYKNAVQFDAEPMMVMSIKENWNSIEDYQSELSSKYRVRYKKVLEKSAALKKIIATGTELSEEQKIKMVSLLKETLKEKTIALPKDLYEVFNSFVSFYKHKFITQSYYLNDELVGFMSFVKKSDKTLFAMHVGFEPGVAQTTSIYQRMLYDAIEYAISEKLLSINFGRTATEIKSTVGAVPVPNSFLVFVRNPLLKFLANYYLKHFYKPEKYIIRNPFKTT